MLSLGHTWELHEVQTEDGWTLAMFRILGNESKVADPIIVQHSWGQDAHSWLAEGANTGAAWPLQLVERGYDVWMPNSRGTRYSNVNEKDGEWSDIERWDFSYVEMGLYDQPAFIDKVLEVTDK